ncbi:hypothetical protein [Arcticibacterium luteifluviistationis]|uniref:Uncharacterized protein n=1 Tax=Arcticibacterium luteifluviistationis TaxID=1784714 RepID=A0A2Z4GGL8_9BACT|nr:hypothetical protein [Arcticibacterium luteifluviistationis]AWW00540.1 hypothetical protein DJ013_21075 [Arcticibacterium luteifluviistationis]
MKKLLTLALLAFGVSNSYAQDAAKFDKYIGEYSVKDAPFSTIIISMNGGSLWGEAVGSGDSELLASDQENVFDLTSVDGTVSFAAEQGIIKSVVLSMNGEQVTGTRQFAPLSDFAGVYNFEAGGPVSKITVGEENGELSIDVPEFGQSTIENTSVNDMFYEPNYQSDFIFERNENGEVVKLKVDVKSQGVTLMGEKEMAATENSLEMYVGNFNFVDIDMSLQTKIKDGKIYGITEQGEAFLSATDEAHLYNIEGVPGTVKFKVNEVGSVTEVVLTYDGQPMTAYPSAE